VPNETEPLLPDLAEAARGAVKKSTGGVASPPGRGSGERSVLAPLWHKTTRKRKTDPAVERLGWNKKI
jgi:hypothetical protein